MKENSGEPISRSRFAGSTRFSRDVQNAMLAGESALMRTPASGDKGHKLRYLEEAYRQHSAWLALIQNEPVLDFVHSEPRYQAIVNRMGLPPAK